MHFSSRVSLACWTVSILIACFGVKQFSAGKGKDKQLAADKQSESTVQVEPKSESPAPEGEVSDPKVLPLPTTGLFSSNNS